MRKKHSKLWYIPSNPKKDIKIIKKYYKQKEKKLKKVEKNEQKHKNKASNNGII